MTHRIFLTSLHFKLVASNQCLNLCMESQDSVGTSRKARGSCSVCEAERKLHGIDGKVYLHGHRADPRKGSHKLPRNAIRQSSADEENDTTRAGYPTDTSHPSADDQYCFDIGWPCKEE